MDKQSELVSFPTIYLGKTRVVNHLIIFQTTFPRVDDSLSLILVDSSLRTTNTEKQVQNLGLQLLEPSRRPRSGIVFHWPWTQTIPTNA